MGASAAEQAWLAEACGGSVVEFFAQLGVHIPQGSGSEASVRCFANPAAHKHDDRVKSCSINLGTGLFKCHGCGEKGNAYQAALVMGRPETDARRLAKQYGLFIERQQREKPKLPTETQLKKWRKQLRESPKLLERLWETRGWTAKAIWRLGLGWDGERLVFTIRDPRLRVAGVVRYLPGGSPKTLAMAGTKRGLFPAPELFGRQHLFVVEGEPDAVAMRSVGLPAVGVPGAQSWKFEWAQRLAGRDLTVICDCDGPGRDLARDISGGLPRARVVDLDSGRSDGFDVGDVVREAAQMGCLGEARVLFERLRVSGGGS